MQLRHNAASSYPRRCCATCLSTMRIALIDSLMMMMMMSPDGHLVRLFPVLVAHLLSTPHRDFRELRPLPPNESHRTPRQNMQLRVAVEGVKTNMLLLCHAMPRLRETNNTKLQSVRFT